jgi:tetratricopeptide (TPR) repeat protein
LGPTKTKPLRVRQILLIALIACGCTNSDGINPVSKATPTSTDFQTGEAFFYSNTKKDSAFYYFTNVTESSEDSLLVAMAYTYMAMIQDDAGDYFGGQESALEGLRQVNEKNPQHHYCISSIYNELGVSSAGLKNYNAAIEYYDLAIKFQQDDTYKNIFQNNKAVAYREKGDYPEAISILASLMEKQRNNKLAYARALTNLASIKWLADPAFYPVPEFLNALSIRRQEKNDIGIASSYNHLSDYYLLHNPDSALFYARSMYMMAQIVNSADQKLDALRKLVSLAPAAESKMHFRKYQYLNDSIVTGRNKAKNQFALIKYQAEKSKAENLLLQKDNSQKELKILYQQVWIYGILTMVTLVILFVFWWLRKKRQQLKWESQTAIRDNHLKTSQKVHDIVANGLYRIMNEIEYKDGIEKDALLDRIDQLYERSRDISYEPAVYEYGVTERISEIITSFAAPQTTISLVGNQEKIWDMVPPEVSKEIEHVLQELMINMSKHSGAHHVAVRFSRADDTLMISYRDDGTGFQPEFKYGNGLKSTENRIRKMGGQLIFAVESTAGASIKIVIPISTR